MFLQNVIDKFHQRSIERSMSNKKLSMQYRSVTDQENSVKFLINRSKGILEPMHKMKSLKIPKLNDELQTVQHSLIKIFES